MKMRKYRISVVKLVEEDLNVEVPANSELPLLELLRNAAVAKLGCSVRPDIWYDCLSEFDTDEKEDSE